ncbi:ectonucleoside triphosphate diphosphohydrolase 7 isoform X1 [Pyrgilauda ruficollis]|uniref:ectonucleoside triphosphate diphosphohydrolase 7 isoform X1 n=1 Tax=Pyrgilauda ruficollis TaxID=221976 RepID=UPI001B86F508|nr:ectonucleoside triphosphate diphosphohydrolase 7 isoform X1 [Pyrgilauda ruficollis]
MARVGVFCLSWRSVGPCPGPRQRPAALGLALLLGLLLLLAAVVPRRWAAPPRASRRDERYLARAEELTATDTEDSSLNYGVVVDCGSSGSRVFVYFWPPHNGNPHDLLDIKQMRDRSSRPVVKKIKPGISVTAAAPEQATPYLRPLLRFAAAHVPPRKHKETPLYILCTAGMRLLPERQQAAILEDLVTNVPLEFDFLFSKSHAEVISGKQEGVYSWIGINFVLGRFDHEDEEDAVVTVALGDQGKSLVRKRTVGILDMGGASLQIAYEVPDSGAISSPQQQDEAAKSLLAEFNLGCDVQHAGHMYRVYVNTFLGFGGNFARQRYEELVLNQTYAHNRLQGGPSYWLLAFPTLTSPSPAPIHSAHLSIASPPRALLSPVSPFLPRALHEAVTRVGGLVPSLHNQQTGLNPKMPFLDPCLPVGLEDTVVRSGQTLYIRGRGDWQACGKLLQPLLAGSNGSHASLVETYKAPIDFSNSEFYGFSEFFYCTEDVLRLGGQYSAPTFTSAAQEYCSQRWEVLTQRFRGGLYSAHADQHRLKYQCFKSAWMYQVLHEGFQFPLDYPSLRTAQLVYDREVQWTLGAILYKTRFLPLRDLRQESIRQAHASWLRLSFVYNHYLFFACILVVALAIVLYLLRLRRIHRRQLRSAQHTLLWLDKVVVPLGQGSVP